MNAAPDPGEAGLVGGIPVRRPLQHHVNARAFLEDQEGVFRRYELPYPAGEVCRAGDLLHDGRRGAAEGGVAGNVAREIGRNEGRPLVGHPERGVDPADARHVRARIGDRLGSDPRADLGQRQGGAVFQARGVQ